MAWLIPDDELGLVVAAGLERELGGSPAVVQYHIKRCRRQYGPDWGTIPGPVDVGQWADQASTPSKAELRELARMRLFEALEHEKIEIAIKAVTLIEALPDDPPTKHGKSKAEVDAAIKRTLARFTDSATH